MPPKAVRPGYLVVLFETSFQTNGDRNAVWMMISVLPLTFIVVLLRAWRTEGRWKKADSEN